MRNTLVITLGAILVAAAPGLQAADAAAGKTKAAGCAGCHGLNGMSNNPMYPNLAGQKEIYLVKAMKDYRDDHRKDPMMGSMVKGMSDGDFADLAAFYASQKP